MSDEYPDGEEERVRAPAEFDDPAFFRTLASNTSEGLLTLDEESTVVYANPAIEQVLGYDPHELVGQTVEKIIPEYLRRPHVESFHRYLDTGERRVDWNGVELPALHADGHEVAVAVSFREHEYGRRRLFTGIIRDITDRRERERRLYAFRQAIEHAGHSIYVTDTDGTISYVNSTFEKQTGYDAEEAVGKTPHVLSSDEHDEAFYRDVWNTVLGGDVWEGEVTNRRKTGERYTVRQTIVPTTDANGEIEQFVAVNVDITEQKARKRELERQRNSLDRLRQITDSLRPINRVLSRASTREEIDQRVCELVAASEVYAFAWVGEYPSGARPVEPRTWSGIEADYFDVLSAANENYSGPKPVERATRTRKVQAVRNIVEEPPTESWRERALDRGYRSAAAVPLVYGGSLYGVLGVYSTRPFAFDAHEQTLLQELGERIGHAIHASESSRLLHTDTVVELEFRSTASEALLVGVSEEFDCRIELRKYAPASEGAYLCYFSISGAAPERVCDRLDRAPVIDGARTVRSADDGGVIECTLTGASPGITLIEHGATMTRASAEEGELTLVGEVASSTDTRPIIERMQAAFLETDLVAKRTVDRSPRPKNGPDGRTPETVLTDRQREVLEVAYHAGYFTQPRRTNGDTVAAALDISSPTFYQHVRRGTQKLMELWLADGE